MNLIKVTKFIFNISHLPFFQVANLQTDTEKQK